MQQQNSSYSSRSSRSPQFTAIILHSSSCSQPKPLSTAASRSRDVQPQIQWLAAVIREPHLSQLQLHVIEEAIKGVAVGLQKTARRRSGIRWADSIRPLGHEGGDLLGGSRILVVERGMKNSEYTSVCTRFGLFSLYWFAWVVREERVRNRLLGGKFVFLEKQQSVKRVENPGCLWGEFGRSNKRGERIGVIAGVVVWWVVWFGVGVGKSVLVLGLEVGGERKRVVAAKWDVGKGGWVARKDGYALCFVVESRDGYKEFFLIFTTLKAGN
ncbi:hypothetical protein ACLOJK_004706, partial [Asimina triloba]